MRSSRWAMAMVGVMALLVVTTVASASPPSSMSGDVLDDRFVNDDRQETIEANVRGSLLTVKNTNRRAVAKGVNSRTTTGSAIYGNSPKGYGVYGYTKDGYAVYGRDAGTAKGRGYGGYFTSNTGVGVLGYNTATPSGNNNYTPGVYGRSKNGVGVMGWGEGDTSGTGWGGVGVFGYGRDNVGGTFWTYSGDIIEGYQDVSGNMVTVNRRFRVTNGGYVYADGSYNCGLATEDACLNAGTGADIAERIDATDTFEPGDVVEIDPEKVGQFRKASTPYSTLVAGIISTSPAMTLGNDYDGETEDWEDNRPLLALVGSVPVKASAINGPIGVGDLLTSSSIPGYAMRADNPVPGTILGKALKPLGEGTGVILVLVTLQ